MPVLPRLVGLDSPDDLCAGPAVRVVLDSCRVARSLIWPTRCLVMYQAARGRGRRESRGLNMHEPIARAGERT